MPQQLQYLSFHGIFQPEKITFLSEQIRTPVNSHGQSSMAITKTLAKKSPAVAPASVLTGSQIRAARALLKWSGRDLAERCGVSYPALQRAESTDDVPNMQVRNLLAIKQALEAAGIVFLDAGQDGGSGVRLKR